VSWIGRWRRMLALGGMDASHREPFGAVMQSKTAGMTAPASSKLPIDRQVELVPGAFDEAMVEESWFLREAS
jgi:hypothetical protein